MVDTGFWLALANKKDEHHEKVKSTMANIKFPADYDLAGHDRNLLLIAHALARASYGCFY